MPKNSKPTGLAGITVSINNLQRKLKQAKRDDLRVSKDELFTVVQFAAKEHAKTMLRASVDDFENCFAAAAVNLHEHPDFAQLTSGQKEAIRREIAAQGKVIDYIINLRQNEGLDINGLRTVLAKALGGILYMMHNRDMDNVRSDLNNMSTLAVDHCREFGAKVMGWEQLFKKEG